MRPIALLSFWQLKNAIRTTLTEPKKLIPALVFFSIFGFQTFVILVTGGDDRMPSGMFADLMTRYGSAIHGILFLLLVLGAMGFLETGFTGGALTFSMADIDYLFPAPIPRRVVLAYHLPAIFWKYLLQAGILLWVGFIMVTNAVGPENIRPGTGGLVLLSLAAWLAGYANLAVTLEIIYGRGRAPLARRAAVAFALVLALWVGLLVWQHGWLGVSIAGRNPVLQGLFFPCRLLADTLMAPVTGRGVGWQMLGLLAFFGATLALALTRRENYYETSLPHSERMSRIRQAAREGNIGAILSLRARERAGKAGSRRGMERARPYTIPPFGRGAVAVLWANFAAAAKRPVINFIAPFGGGLVVAVAALVWTGEAAPFAVLAAMGYVAYGVLISASRSAFRQSIERQSLIRPMPIKPWKLAVAEVLPVAFTASLFGWGAAIPLAFSQQAHARLAAAVAAFPVPVALMDLCLISYAVMLWYPQAQDKLQQLLAGLVMMALFGLYLLALSPFVAVPRLLHAPLGMAVVMVTVGALLAVPVLLFMAARALRGLSTS